MRQILDPQSEELNIDLIFDVLQYICNNEKTEGAVLVFLPGIVQITALHRMLTDSEQFPSCKFDAFFHSLRISVDDMCFMTPRL